MSKYSSTILMLLFTAGCMHDPVMARNDSSHVPKKGKALINIVVVEDASESVQHAAAELAGFLGQVTGSTLPIVHKPGEAKYHLLVGPAAAKFADTDFSTKALGQEGIVIRSMGNKTIIAGGQPRGTLYAVYTFLEDYAGCRWWASDSSTIPKNPDFAIPRDLDVRYVPPLEYRWPFLTHINADADLSVRNKINGPQGLLDKQYGGNMSHGGVHTFYKLIPPELYFDKHPEWFSKIRGKRKHHRAQLCLSNKVMRQELTKRLREAIIKTPVPPVYSVSQNDWSGYCTCKRCNELAKQYGGQSGIMIWFVNQVAEEIEKEFPAVSLSTLAYRYTRKSPKNIRPRKNVIITLCSIECSFSVPLEHNRNRSFRNDIIAWSKISDRLYVWDYTANFSHHFLPHPNLRVLKPNIQFLLNHNAKGVFEQGIWNSLGSELAELRGWVMAKLLWDPSLDDKKLIKEFVQGYYTKSAAPNILAYIDIMHNAVAASNDKLGCYSKPNAKFLTFSTLNKGWAELLAAEKAVGGDAVALNRVKMLQLPVIYTFIMKWGAFRNQCQKANAVWPMAENIEEVAQGFKTIATANKVTRLKETQKGFALINQAVQRSKK